MNDLGSDIKCPNCSGHLQPERVNKQYYFICACGYGKDEFRKAKEEFNKEKEKDIKTKKIKNAFKIIFCFFIFLVGLCIIIQGFRVGEYTFWEILMNKQKYTSRNGSFFYFLSGGLIWFLDIYIIGKLFD